MATTQIGTDLVIGVGTTMGSYIVESITYNQDDIKTKDIFDEDGALKTRLVHFVHDGITLSLIALSGATPQTDFPKGSICAVAPLSNYYIEDASVVRNEGEERVTVTGKNIGIT